MVDTVDLDDDAFIARAPGAGPKLTEWTKEPSLTVLKEDVTSSKQYHDTWVLSVKRWADIRNATGASKPPKVKGRSQVQPKLVRRQAEWRYSALSEPFLGSDDLFNVDAVSFEDEEGAKQNQLVLNYQFRTKINRVKFIDDYVRTATDEGSVIVRTGWQRVTKMVTKSVKVWNYFEPYAPEQLAMLQQAVDQANSDPRGFEEQAPEEIKAAIAYFKETGKVVVAEDSGETQDVQEEVIVDNRPTVDIMNPDNVFWDPSCGDDLDKAGFVCITFETSKAELLKQPERYKNLEYVNWETATPLMEQEHATNTPQTFNFTDILRKRVVAYEYWGYHDIDGTGELKAIVATWIGDTIIRMEENPFPDKKPPFTVATYMPIKRELMGEPDAEILEDNQKILGAVTRGMIDLLGRSAAGQQGMAKGMLDIVNKRKFESGQDYEFNPNLNPATGYVEHKFPEIPQSAMVMLTLQNQEAEALTGVKSFSGGMSGEAFGEVAAGIRGVLDAASKREMGILRRLAKGIKDIGGKIVTMNQVFLSEKETVRVTNKEFVTINREDLQGQYDLKVDISTAEIDNAKAQDLGFMLQTIGPNLDFDILKMILADIADLKRMPALAERVRKFQKQPDPMQQRLVEAQISREEHEVLKLQSEIRVNDAKAQEILAKANQMDLDTTEQETGTKHERDMDKQRAQSQGNQNLEITKALVGKRKKADGGETDPDIEAAVGWNTMSANMPNGIGNIASFSERNINQNTPSIPQGNRYLGGQPAVTGNI